MRGGKKRKWVGCRKRKGTINTSLDILGERMKEKYSSSTERTVALSSAKNGWGKEGERGCIVL